MADEYAHGGRDRPHVVIIGGGFGGLNAARVLRRKPVKVTLIDRSNHHLFQPLLYQVATAGLSPADIASPIRSILRGQKNARVLLASVTAVDLDRKVVSLAKTELPYREIPYDYLILAAGAETTYYGHDEWSDWAPGLKTIDDALEIRRRVLLAFEAAEREPDSDRRRRLMTFVVIGGGPTGVEMVGALAELSRFVLARDFRVINPRHARVVLIEGGPRILPGFGAEISERARQRLDGMGVQVITESMVRRVDDHGVHFGDEVIPAATVVWGAGVRATTLAETLGVELDPMKRVVVNPDLTIGAHTEAFAVGDIACCRDASGDPLPGVAQVAIQQAKFAAGVIADRVGGEPRHEGDDRPAFVYKDKGTLATIGRKSAVAEIGRVKMTGFIAWVTWCIVHILFLIGFRNRVMVMINWIYSYLTYGRGARLITGGRLRPGPAPDEAAGDERAGSAVEAAAGAGEA